MYNICTMSEVLNSPNGNFKKISEEMVSEVTSPCEEEDDDMPVPERCRYCPRVMAIRDDLDALENSAKCLAIAAMGDKVIISTDGKAIDGDEVTEYLRKMAIEKFNEWEEGTKIAKEEIVRSTNGCKGPLSLEGSDDSHDVCVVICNSPEMYKSDRGKPQIGELVEVRRDLKKDED